MERFRTLVYSTVFLSIVGWVLYIGKTIFVPIFFGAVVVYVIVGFTQALRRIPLVGPALPLQVRYVLSVLVIAFSLTYVVYLVIASRDLVFALAPQYQESLLASIQQIAAFFRIETEPTWTSLRRDLFAQISIQRLASSMLASASSILVTAIVVFLYATFLLVERRHFQTKVAGLSSDPRGIERIRQVTHDINARIGSYLALKTLLSLFLGAVSWAVMAFIGLDFAVFWAVVIAFLNYVPYVGSVLGVLLPLLMAVVQFNDLAAVVYLALGLGVAQFLIGNFLDPYVMGSSLNLSPFAILVSLAIWSELWGIPGAFLAVPITAVMVIVFSEFPATRPIAVLLSQNGRL